jgi:hypothetical protein
VEAIGARKRVVPNDPGRVIIAHEEEDDMANKNPRVSADEIMSRRVIEEQSSEGSAEGQPVAKSLPAPAPAPATSIAANSLPKLPDLDAILSAATPEQLAKLRALSTAKGISVPSSAVGTKRADGSMTVEVHLEGPIVEQLELWAEADGCTLIEEAQKRLSEALTNYLYGDWNPVVEQPPAAVAAAVAATK